MCQTYELKPSMEMEECAICLSDIGNQRIVTQCQHSFNPECLEPALVER